MSDVRLALALACALALLAACDRDAPPAGSAPASAAAAQRPAGDGDARTAAEAETSRATDADIAAIADFNRRYLGAINAGDIDALAALTTDGHIMLAPNRAPLLGKAANIDAMADVFEQFDIDETWTPVETVVNGDLAYQRGTFTVAATPKAGGPTNRTAGSFLRIYRRQPNGEWRMIRDMFNSDEMPAASP